MKTKTLFAAALQKAPAPAPAPAPTIQGTKNNDSLMGTAGVDVISAGGGSDTVNGAGGSDTLDGGTGNDLLLYAPRQNVGSTDVYTGGGGTDTLRLLLTSQEQTLYQYQITALQKFIASKPASTATFTVEFAGAKLTISSIEALNITTVQAPAWSNPLPIAITEPGKAQITTTGSTPLLLFSDADPGDFHTVTVKPVAMGLGGTLPLGQLAFDRTGQPTGFARWTYTAPPDGWDRLSQGDVRVESFEVTVTDSLGYSTTGLVSVRVTGVNDPVQLAAGNVNLPAVNEVAGAPTPDLRLTISGTIAYSDLDWNDFYSFQIDTPANALGLLNVTAIPLDPVNTPGPGNVGFNFSVPAQALEWLGNGETLQQTYKVRMLEGMLGRTATTPERQVTVALVGSNDNAAWVGSAAGSVVALRGPDGNLVAFGGRNFIDPDWNDSHTVLLAPTAGGTAAPWALSYQLQQDTRVPQGGTSQPAGVVNWSATLPSTDPAYIALKEGATYELPLTLSVSQFDSKGASVGQALTQAITVVAVGVNDAPTIATPAAQSVWSLGQLAKDELPTRSDSCVVADPDVGDTLTVSVDPNAAAWGVLTPSIRASTVPGQYTVSWTYALTDTGKILYDGLAATGTKSETFTIRVTDSGGLQVLQSVSVNYQGIDDPAEYDADRSTSTGSVTADRQSFFAPGSAATTSGIIHFNDPDPGQSGVDIPDGTNRPGENGYGTFFFQVGDDQLMHWTYRLDPWKVFSLATSEDALTDTLQARSIDGSASRELSVTISIPSFDSWITLNPDSENDDSKNFVGTSVDEIVFGGKGHDTIDGQGGNDVLIGGDGNDSLTGGRSSDILVGGSGADYLKGFGGGDYYVFNTAPAADEVDFLYAFTAAENSRAGPSYPPDHLALDLAVFDGLVGNTLPGEQPALSPERFMPYGDLAQAGGQAAILYEQTAETSEPDTRPMPVYTLYYLPAGSGQLPHPFAQVAVLQGSLTAQDILLFAH